MNDNDRKEFQDFLFMITAEAVQKALDETGIPQRLEKMEKGLDELEATNKDILADYKGILRDLQRNINTFKKHLEEHLAG